MPKREVKVLKTLCHSDGSPFAAWHRELTAYAMYFTDDDKPAAPESLEINDGGHIDHSTLVWCPVIQIIEPPDGEAEVWGGSYGESI